MVMGKSHNKGFGGQDPRGRDCEWDSPAPHSCHLSIDWGGWSQAPAVEMRGCPHLIPVPVGGVLDPAKGLVLFRFSRREEKILLEPRARDLSSPHTPSTAVGKAYPSLFKHLLKEDSPELAGSHPSSGSKPSFQGQTRQGWRWGCSPDKLVLYCLGMTPPPAAQRGPIAPEQGLTAHASKQL